MSAMPGRAEGSRDRNGRMPTARASRLAAALALAAVTAACGSSGSPSAKPSPSPSSPTPSPTPTLPPVATDTASVKAALAHAADLGKPWVEPKTVNRTKTKKGEFCPGHLGDAARVKARANAETSMTEGAKQGAAIASFSVSAYDPAKLSAWRAAFAAVVKDCASYHAAEGTYVTAQLVTSPLAVAGADEVLVRIERVWADAAHKTLYYVRQNVKCVVGDRYVVSIEHAFIQPKSDPTGADFAKTVRLLEKQVAKARTKLAV